MLKQTKMIISKMCKSYFLFRFSGVMLLAIVVGQLAGLNGADEEGPVSSKFSIGISSEFKADELVGPIKMVNSTPAQALQMLSELSGRIIIPEGKLPNVKINFSSQGKLRRDEAIYAIENLLILNNIVISNLDGKFLKAVNDKQVYNNAPEIIDDLGDAEMGSGKFFGKYFRIQHLDSNDAMKQIKPLVRNGVGGIFQYEQSNSFMIYESLSNLQQIQEILERIDVPPSGRFQVYFYPLKYVSANTVRNNLNNLQRQGFKDELKQHLFLVDSRTNQIIATMLPSNEPLIRNIIEKMDAEISPLTTSQVFYLEHAMSRQVYGTLNNLINNQRRIWDRMGFRASDSVRTEKTEITQREEEDSTEMDGPVAEVEGAETAIPMNPVEESSLMFDDGMPELQFSPYAIVIADSRANSIVAYGTQNDIKRVGNLIKELDKDVAPLTTSKIYFLSHAQSPVLTRMVSNLINTQRNNFRRQGFLDSGARNNNEVPVSANSIDVEFSPYASVISDTRSNSILAYGTEGDIQRIQKIIVDLDVDVAPITKSNTFFIKNGVARDMARTIQQIVSQQQSIRQRESTQKKTFIRDEEEMQGNNAQEEINYESSPDSNLSIDERQFSPYISIVADERSNSIVTYGTDNDLRQIEDLISQIDVVLNQVRIEVVIAEVGLTDQQVSGLESFGIDFKKPIAGLISPGNYNLSASTPNLGDTGNPSLNLQTSLKDFSLAFVLNKAKEDRNVKILSSPTIVTTHNHPASINVGEARPIITSSTSSLNNSDLATRSTVEYRDIGITLRVRPLIGDNGLIQMEIEQIVETVVDTQTIDNNVQPIIGTRRATSFVSIQNEETLVMAGLQSVESQNSDGKVFILGSIPVVGRLFSPKSKKEITRELIIFIKPIIVMDRGNPRGDAMNESVKMPLLRNDIDTFMNKGSLHK